MLKRIGFYGLSHLGLCYSAAYVKKNFDVIAVDPSAQRVKNLKKNILEVYEKNL